MGGLERSLHPHDVYESLYRTRINERIIPTVKELQSALLASFYALLPPVRNNYDGLRFVEHDGAYDASSDLSFEEYLDGTAKERDR